LIIIIEDAQLLTAVMPPLESLTLSSKFDERAAVPHPGTIKINVQGAFIVDDQPPTPVPERTDEFDYSHDTEDIRLPNHINVVSHVAVDVCIYVLYLVSNKAHQLTLLRPRLEAPLRSSSTSPMNPARNN